MRNIMRGLMFVAALALPSRLAAQPGHADVLVMTVAQLEQPAAAEIVQRIKSSPTYVVLLPDGFTPSVFMTAMRSVQRQRATYGDDPAMSAKVFIYGGLAVERFSAAEVAATSEYLAKLAKAPERNIPGIGRGHAVRVPLAAN